MNTEIIDNVFEFVRNGVPIKQDDSKGGIPITRIETIWNSGIDENRLGYADISIQNIGKYENYLLKTGDILMTHINSPKHLGKSAMYENSPEYLIHGMNLLCLRPNQELLVPKYAKYFFKTNSFLSEIESISNQSVNQASFSGGNLKKLKIPLPPLENQKKIADILDEADKLRQLNKQLITKYEALTQCLFLEMFGDTWINPKNWEIKFVEELASKEKHSIKAGPFGSSLKKEFYVERGYKIYGQEQVIKDNLSFGDYYIDEKKYQELKNCEIKSGDILISLVGTYGKIAVVPDIYEPGIINPRLMKISPNQDIIRPDFLKVLLQSSASLIQMKNQSRGGTMDIVNVGIMRKIKLPLPPIFLQNIFSERTLLIEQQKVQAQEALQKSEELFNSLLQKAFKGELVK